MKHSDYSLIPTFVAIVEEKSYTKAAKRLGISQSAVSQGVTRLQAVFKDTLFIRGSRGVEPTQFSLDIYPTLASSVENIAFMMPEYKKFSAVKCEKQFVISSLSVFGFTILPPLSALMSQHAPLASVKIEPLNNHDFTNMLRSQHFDLVIDAHSNQYPQLRSKVIMEDTLCVMCRIDHPRLSGDSISIDEFLAEKHVTHSQLDQKGGYLSGKGLKEDEILNQRKIAWQAASIMEMLPVIECCDYIALLPQRLVDKYRHIYQLKQLHSNFLLDPIKVAMYWHSSRTNDPSHKWLREQIVKVTQQFNKL
ncbi:LysR family transcriptional regulator [Colwellia psychrerythraea]|jgi:DNA-binding transcriptional LysR family regulator|uniref:Transcriptional regulator, LysR family n=1 Tax=Colwellia psychrerythraea (strain 34H / ATCC BAA-681) TaxID=167879 RepID=Q486J0_COLP3|nr:LysR family transcriptional regulator [Colwellia psychrerythraea]AAZ27324.1 transcriptional regulator, LysR family [Colwellia psychrerythraea 34H]